MQATEQIERSAQRLSPGQAVVACLRANGVDTVFGLDGSHVIQIYDALSDAPEIRSITVKHENNAAIAAEVYGRLTGRPGVVVVTAGPGATNSLSGVAGAYAAGAPVVHISGGVAPGSAKEAFHGVDEPDFLLRAFESVTKWSARVTEASQIPKALNRAFAIAVAGRPGPVHVEIAENALKEEPVDVSTAAPTPTPDLGEGWGGGPGFDTLIQRIDSAESVAIVAGKGAWWPRVSAELVRLAERIGAPVAHTWDGHAAMPTVHPLSASLWWGEARSHPIAARLVSEADLVLGVGAREGTEATLGLAEEAGERLVLLNPSDLGASSDPVAIPSVDGLAAALARLADECRARPAASAALEACAQARELLRRGLEIELERHRSARPWHIGLALDALARRITPDTIVVSDVSNVKLWAPLQLPAFGPESHIQAGSWGAMGYALPGVLAAGLLRPEKKIIGLAGDTSFLMASSDFGTICQLGLPVVVAVHSDGQIGMITNMLTRAYGRAYATEIGEVDFVRYAEAFGGHGIRVDDPSQLDAAWDQALAADGPVVLDIRAGHDFPWPWPVSRLIEQAMEDVGAKHSPGRVG
ncbi:MAG TPA: thiamine pyrophosphate-binding protein [Chloroflexota bacterium]|nr:thiamine pyrophosphate-binding protein [Chloroflexota bacterium]